MGQGRRRAAREGVRAVSKGRYTLNASGEIVPCDDLFEWARWFETADRTIALTQLDGMRVSTVFLGLDHSFGSGEPLLFETLIFGGPHDGEGKRYATREQAMVGHELFVLVAQGKTTAEAIDEMETGLV